MNQTEALMQKVRDTEKGTYASGQAWVNYMRHARNHGTQDRRVFAAMMRKHLKWPLSMQVAVKTPQGYFFGKISGHISHRPHSCYVDFSPNLVSFDGYSPRLSAIVPFRNIKKINPK